MEYNYIQPIIGQKTKAVGPAKTSPGLEEHQTIYRQFGAPKFLVPHHQAQGPSDKVM